MATLDECYGTLGMAAYAPKSEVKEKFRLLAQVWHPDRFERQRIRAQAEEQMKLITAAYKQIELAGFPERAGMAADRQEGPRAESERGGDGGLRKLCRCPWCGVQNRLPLDYGSQEVACGGCKRYFRLDESDEPLRVSRPRNAQRASDRDSWTPSLVKCPTCAAPNWCTPEEMVLCTACGTFFSWS